MRDWFGRKCSDQIRISGVFPGSFFGRFVNEIGPGQVADETHMCA